MEDKIQDSLFIFDSYQNSEIAPRVIKKTWQGENLIPEQKFFISINENYLTFGGEFLHSTISHPSSSANKFFRGLWDYDVLELFIKPCLSSNYIEINISPNGAWWAAEFVDYRKETRELNSKDIKIEITNTINIIIPINFFPFNLSRNNIGTFLGNVTGIRTNNLGKEKTYFSYSTPRSKTPDFHNQQILLPFKLIK